jgi:hypothetical protein
MYLFDMLALKLILLPLIFATLKKIYEMFINKNYALFWFLFKGILVTAYIIVGVWSVADFCDLLILILIETFLVVNFADKFRNFFAIYLLFSLNSPGMFSIVIGKSSIESIFYMVFDEKMAGELATETVKTLKKYPKTTKVLVFAGLTYYGVKGCVNSWDTFLNTQYIIPGEKKLDFIEKNLNLYKMRVESKDPSLSDTDLKNFQENTKFYTEINKDVYKMKKKRWF